MMVRRLLSHWVSVTFQGGYVKLPGGKSQTTKKPPLQQRLRTPEELVRDKGRRVHDLSYEGLTHILWVGEPLLVGSGSDELG